MDNFLTLYHSDINLLVFSMKICIVENNSIFWHMQVWSLLFNNVVTSVSFDHSNIKLPNNSA